MGETVNQAIKENPDANVNSDPERTFTQSEMDAIIRDRLERERKKYVDYETMKEKAEKFDASVEASKTELQKAQEKAEALQKQVDQLTSADELRKLRDKISKETGVPAELLSGNDEESCTTQAKAILAFAKPGAYPSVKDGGEVTKSSGQSSTSQKFADWFKESIK